jgi:hypothetical protein
MNRDVISRSAVEGQAGLRLASRQSKLLSFIVISDIISFLPMLKMELFCLVSFKDPLTPLFSRILLSNFFIIAEDGPPPSLFLSWITPPFITQIR